MKYTRPEPDIARYKSIPHPQAKENPDGRKIFIENRKLDHKDHEMDGLDSLNGLFNSGVYEVNTIKKTFTHTLISVNVKQKK